MTPLKSTLPELAVIGLWEKNMEENTERQVSESGENERSSGASVDASLSLLQESFDSARNSTASSDHRASSAGKDDAPSPLSSSERNNLVSRLMQQQASERPASIDQGRNGAIDRLGRVQMILPNLILDDSNKLQSGEKRSRRNRKVDGSRDRDCALPSSGIF